MEQNRTRAGCLTFVSGMVVVIAVSIFAFWDRLFTPNGSGNTNALNPALCSVIFLPGGLGAIGLLYYGAFFQETFTETEGKALRHQAVALILLLIVLYGLGLATGWGQAETSALSLMLALVASALAGYVGVVTLKTRITIVAPKGMSRKGRNAIVFGAVDILVSFVGLLLVTIGFYKINVWLTFIRLLMQTK